MRHSLLVFGYVAATTCAIVLIKLGAARTALSVSSGVVSGQLDGRTAAGVVLYALSFVLWMVLLSTKPVVYIVPLTTALVHLSIFGAAVLILQERVTSLQLTGIVLVVAGAALVGFKSA